MIYWENDVHTTIKEARFCHICLYFSKTCTITFLKRKIGACQKIMFISYLYSIDLLIDKNLRNLSTKQFPSNKFNLVFCLTIQFLFFIINHMDENCQWF